MNISEFSQCSACGACENICPKKAISMDTLFDIAEALDVPAHKFLTFEEDAV